ncbi:MAG: helix-turn-helix domain-containing protein [Holosporales bacterium]|jgi:transcriptional regulator with XRE-family HTH domain|nr:helix-turn-helix domain-containing protein [Holosporales bacterium]
MALPSEYHKDAVSVRIGELIRKRRKELSLTQKDLAQKLNITAQQIQKYETGVNCPKIDRMIEFCQVLILPVSYFFLTAAQTPSVLQESASEEFEVGTGKDKPAAPKVTLQEIDEFLMQFLLLKDETKSYIIALVNDLSKAQRGFAPEHNKDANKEDD